ncbi:protein diaphanous homolog 1-like isoform X1 [Lethenteron reissneri]|uniref:protein diaphanous homolog 1-like isoform X1 n=1 Tax=Lethenteron reissneri TaxID=7753 RepID=UPI002AB79625|nr:protein diaphanous homolog 1-like isoform X1 [Lethenteron reissneri]XP_061414630.1 protein diaphanous homolog 1-like isoform X1 [Lethenteron reissneri]
MGNCCSCCPSWCSCPAGDGYEPLPGENNEGHPRQTPGGAHNEFPAPEPRDTGLPGPPVAAFPAPEPRDTGLPGPPVAAFPAPEPRDTGLPGPPVAAFPAPEPRDTGLPGLPVAAFPAPEPRDTGLPGLPVAAFPAPEPRDTGLPGPPVAAFPAPEPRDTGLPGLPVAAFPAPEPRDTGLPGPPIAAFPAPEPRDTGLPGLPVAAFPAPEPRDTGLPGLPVAAFPAPEPWDTGLPGLPIAAFPAPEPWDTGLPGPPIAASVRPGPSSQDEVPPVIVQQPDTPSASGQRPSLGIFDLTPQDPSVGGPSPPPPPPAFIPGMAPTLARPLWLKEKKPYNKKGATERVRCKTIVPSDIKKESLWSSANEKQFENSDLKDRLLRTFAAKTSLGVPIFQPSSSGSSPLPSPSGSPSEGSVFSTQLLQNLEILRKSVKVSDNDFIKAILTGDMAFLSGIKNFQGLIEKLQSVTEKQKKALQDKQGNGAPLQKMEFFYLQLVEEGHLSERLRCLRFHFTRAEVLDQARNEQEVVLAALSAVVSSQGLAQLAQLLLFILNFLNEGPTSAPAYGINLCDIDKINSVKMTDPAESGTLLDLVVRECQKSHPDILNIITELEPVDKATRVDDENLTSVIRSLRADITKLEGDLNSLPDTEPHGLFSKTMQPLLQEWTQKVELLERGESEIGAEWERLRVKFSLKGETPKLLLSSLATFRGDFKKIMDKGNRRSLRRKSFNDLYDVAARSGPVHPLNRR